MCSQSNAISRTDNISFPRSKLEALFEEARAIGCPLVTLAAIAKVLGLSSQGSLTPLFGHHVNNETGSNPRRHLLTIVMAFNEHGIAVEAAWFDLDPPQFRQRLADARRARPAPTHDIAPTPSTDTWRVADPVHLSQGIAALFIHPPPPANDPDTFQLRVSLSLATWPDEVDDIPLRIGLRNAWIVPAFAGCQPREWHLPDALKRTANTLAVLEPREGPVLDGTVMEQHTLTTLEHTSGTRPAVTLELRSRKVDLAVVPEDPSAVSVNRQKVLQRFLAECLVSEEERQVTWSRARMARRSDDETDA